MTDDPSNADIDAMADRSPRPKPAFGVGRVLLLLVPLVAFILLSFYAFAYHDGLKWLMDLFRPPLVAGSGRVFWGDEPLAGGELRTRHANSRLPGAVGFIDSEGNFALRTDMDGDLVPGAFIGEHAVTVVKRENASGPVTPPLITPEDYATFEKSPLKISIDPSLENNHFVIRLEGNPPVDGSPEPGGRGWMPSRPSRETTDPVTVVRETMEKLDQNGDGELTVAESRRAGPPLSYGLAQADKNSDGKIDSAEMTRVVEEYLGTSATRAESAKDQP